jgi:hypothetical protein
MCVLVKRQRCTCRSIREGCAISKPRSPVFTVSALKISPTQVNHFPEMEICACVCVWSESCGRETTDIHMSFTWRARAHSACRGISMVLLVCGAS